MHLCFQMFRVGVRLCLRRYFHPLPSPWSALVRFYTAGSLDPADGKYKMNFSLEKVSRRSVHHTALKLV